MVSQATITAMGSQILISMILVLTLLIFYSRTLKISYRAIGVGILIFIVFSQMLEQALHVFMFSVNPTTSEWLKNPWMTAVYGALAAAIFENVGRWLGFSLLLKKRRAYKDGIGVGIGHGGIETLMIGVGMGIMGIVYAFTINTGTFEQGLGAQATPEQVAQLQVLKDRILQTPLVEYWLGAVERIPAMFIQIALSLIVLYGIRTRRAVYLLYAMLFHAFIDFFAGLFQGKILSLWIVEVVVWAGAAAAVWVIVKSKDWFAALDSDGKNTTY